MDRVRETIKVYKELPNNAGAFASGMMSYSIKSAEEVISIGDTVGMFKALENLKRYDQ